MRQRNIERLLIAIFMLCIIGGCSNNSIIDDEELPVSTGFFDEGKDTKMQIVKKDKFEFELQLCNKENISSLIPAISKDDMVDYQKYIFGCVKNLGDRASYLVFKVTSPNNRFLTSDEVSLSIIGKKTYFLLWAKSPFMHTMDKDAVFDVKIIKAVFK